jgi:hypothetical protein
LSYHRRVRAALVAVLLIVPGCDRIFGLTRDSQPADAASDVDPGTDTVTGRWRLIYTTNQADGSPLVAEIPHPDGKLFMYREGDVVEIPMDADGSFSFKRQPGAAYQLRRNSELDGDVTVELQSAAPHVELASRLAGRPDRVPVTQPTTLTFANNTLPGEHIIASTGLWTESTIVASNMIDWRTAASASGALGLLDASQHDRLWYLNRIELADAAANPYHAFSALASTSITIMDGVAQAVPIAPMAGLVRDQCVRVAAKRAAALQRAIAAAGGTGPLLIDDWLVQAVPAKSNGPTGTITLAFHGESTTTPTDRTTDVQYHNPFLGHQVLASIGSLAQRVIKHPAATIGIALSFGERIYVDPLPCPMTTTVEPFQGYPGSVSIDGVQLGSSDGADVVIAPNEPVEMSWTLLAPGPVDLSSALIYRVETSLDGVKTVLTPVTRFLTTSRSVTLRAGVLSSFDYYVVRIDAIVGYPGAASGDFRTIAYPFSIATQWSRMFRVVNQ